MNAYRIAACLGCSLLLAACGDDGGSDAESSTGDTPTSTSTTAPTTSTSTTPTTTTATETGETDSTATVGPGTDTGTDTDEDTESSSGSSSSTGLGVMDVSIQFAARVGDEDAACGTDYVAVGSEDSDIQFRDIRMYVSNLRLVNSADEEVPVELTQDGAWQLGDVALLDFEDASAGCSDTGTAETNTVVVGQVPGDDYTGIRFDLGVPADVNHTDVNLAESPLNILEMNWNWLAGRKFVRIDLNVDELPPNNQWNIHLGSQGCVNDGPDPMSPPDQACARPQRPAVSLDGFDPTTDTIVADIEALLEGVNITENIAGPAGCQSLMMDQDMKSGLSDCDDLFPNYGMDWATGDCVDGCENQTFFSVE